MERTEERRVARTLAARTREISEAYRTDPDAGFVALAGMSPDAMLPLVRVGLQEEARCLDGARRDRETMSREMSRFLHESRKKVLIQAALRSVAGGPWRKASVLAGVGLHGRDLNSTAWEAGGCARVAVSRAGVVSLLGVGAAMTLQSWTSLHEALLGAFLAGAPLIGALWIFWGPISAFLAQLRAARKGRGESGEVLWTAFCMGVRDREGALPGIRG